MLLRGQDGALFSPRQANRDSYDGGASPVAPSSPQAPQDSRRDSTGSRSGRGRRDSFASSVGGGGPFRCELPSPPIRYLCSLCFFFGGGSCRAIRSRTTQTLRRKLRGEYMLWGLCRCSLSDADADDGELTAATIVYRANEREVERGLISCSVDAGAPSAASRRLQTPH
eukprot:COSAG05_NODE_317_length_11545_cov_73.981391_5_plen_169_part_00